MRDICISIIAPAVFTGFFLAMGIMARRDRKEMEQLERRLDAALAHPGQEEKP
jgi:hypothetical protein